MIGVYTNVSSEGCFLDNFLPHFQDVKSKKNTIFLFDGPYPSYVTILLLELCKTFARKVEENIDS